MFTPIKPAVQRFLKTFGLYYRLRASRLYDLYWTLVDRRIIADRRSEVDFYRRSLVGFKQGDLIFDIGANEGYKTNIFLRLGARVVAVEPDPHGQQALRKSFLTMRALQRPVVVVGKAASDTLSRRRLWIHAPGSGKNTLSRKWVDLLSISEQRFGSALDFRTSLEIETTTLEALIQIYGPPFFIKIDVEGHELSVLRGLRCPVPYLSFEVNLPEFATEGKECIERLAALDSGGTFNYTADCRRGFELNTWEETHVFLESFAKCTETSIEVFWKARHGLGGNPHHRHDANPDIAARSSARNRDASVRTVGEVE